ncbi:trans-2-enoyl-CoA reductase family protein [Clostridium sp. 19966]|uniref:enoyl-ACP reductase FabV n=1 Tax=Clostridium sp. 19966 TaxID=2768166 RepID=UPI0028DDBD6A|nr:enoyl-ACP reductase FabV [Clostridium sp. 19966]MDT8718837.1 trans-2-enoyl-CoA reductase family protein [Clostridium sp. 19966]
MVIKPRFKGYICLTAHPQGCANNVSDQIAYVKSQKPVIGPKNVLIIGASTGYGLASRIVSSFASGANTLGVAFERPASGNRTATPGWYNTAAFEQLASEAGYYAKTINGDAFSQPIKQETIAAIKKDLGKIDLVIYSIASPKRTDPGTGETFHSVLKPIGTVYSSKTVDFHTNIISNIELGPATESEIQQTVKVMGGEDWELWIKALVQADVLAEGAKTVAYTYIGSEITKPIYRSGTIGKAKEHLEKTALTLNKYLEKIKGEAYVSSNKALATQASSAIPVVPLYVSLLMKIMKEKNIEEGCIEQIYRLYADRLYSKELILDEEGRIRLDDLELRQDVQEEIIASWDKITSENIAEITDIEDFRKEFFKLFGFEHPKVNYEEDIDANVDIPSLKALE